MQDQGHEWGFQYDLGSNEMGQVHIFFENPRMKTPSFLILADCANILTQTSWNQIRRRRLKIPCSKLQGIFDRKEVCHFQIRSLTPQRLD
jgi:hypothetical protein